MNLRCFFININNLIKYLKTCLFPRVPRNELADKTEHVLGKPRRTDALQARVTNFAHLILQFVNEWEKK